MPTYQLEPIKKFDIKILDKKVQNVIELKTKQMPNHYDDNIMKLHCLSLTNELKQIMKIWGSKRYNIK